MIPELELGLEVFVGGLASYETLRAITVLLGGPGGLRPAA